MEMTRKGFVSLRIHKCLRTGFSNVAKRCFINGCRGLLGRLLGPFRPGWGKQPRSKHPFRSKRFPSFKQFFLVENCSFKSGRSRIKHSEPQTLSDWQQRFPEWKSFIVWN